ncbi:MAG: hypothetical protein N3D85_00415 [Candidatus Bathyarchaeota archaeon]|nr:hypothetical protein [Candidatus Bathyarchaeota archaeon]
MTTPNYDPSKLATIKSYITIAFVFNIIALVAWILAALSQIIAYVTFQSYVYYYYTVSAPISILITGIVFLVFFVLSLIVFMRVRNMYSAVNRGDIATLKQLNNMTWSILALIFAGVIPGILLIMVTGPINEIGQAAPVYPPPPPPT